VNGWSKLTRFLETDPQDAGCAETFELIDVYVDLTLSNGRPELRYPGIAAHLRACRPCASDFEGLLALAGGPLS
jgi:hypothetical protein